MYDATVGRWRQEGRRAAVRYYHHRCKMTILRIKLVLVLLSASTAGGQETAPAGRSAATLKIKLVSNGEPASVAGVLAWIHSADETTGVSASPDRKMSEPDLQVAFRSGLKQNLVCKLNQYLVLSSGDGEPHLWMVAAIHQPPLGWIVQPEKQERYRFSRPAIRPIPVTCALHEDESLWCLCVDRSVAAVSKNDGTVKLSPVAAGTHYVRLWHVDGHFLQATGEGVVATSRGFTVQVTEAQANAGAAVEITARASLVPDPVRQERK
jgi:hypothetical protein